MQFTVKKAEFMKSLKKVSRVISSSTSIPVLAGVKIDADSKGISLTGGNDDMYIRDFMASADKKNGLAVVKGGSIVIGASLFASIIDHLPNGQFTLSTTDEFQVHIASGKSAFNLNGLDASNYPHLPNVDAKQSAQLPSNILQAIIQQTIFATSKQESRPTLTGVHFIIKDSKIYAVATDGHRLSLRAIKLPKVSGESDVIIPASSLKELLGLISNTSNVEVRLGQSEALFLAGNVAMYSRLIEGNYPQIHSLVSKLTKQIKTSVKFSASDLLATTQRAAIIAHANNSDNDVMKLLIDPDNNSIEIKADSADVGKIDETVPMQSASGNKLMIGCNPDYLADALKSLDGEVVSINASAQNSPFIVKPEDNQAGISIQLIVPFHL